MGDADVPLFKYLKYLFKDREDKNTVGRSMLACALPFLPCDPYGCGVRRFWWCRALSPSLFPSDHDGVVSNELRAFPLDGADILAFIIMDFQFPIRPFR